MPGAGPPWNGRGARIVVADQPLRTERDAYLNEATQRNHLSVIAAYIDAIDIVDGGTVLAFGLHLDLPGTPEQVDVVDVEAAERGLQRLEYGVDFDPEDACLVAVNRPGTPMDWSPRRS